MPVLFRHLHFKAWLAALLLTVAACTPFAPKQTGPAPLPLPERYTLYPQDAPAEGNRWWLSFDNEELNGLMDDALADSLTLQEAWARLKQSAAQHRVKGAALYPTLSGEGGAETTWRGGDDTSEESTDSVSLGLAASYEVDLWGRLKSLEESERQRLLASRADVETAAVTLTGEVAETWVALVAIRNEIALVEEQMDLNKTLLTALTWRFENSLVSAVDVLRQKKVIERQLSELPSLRLQESRLEYSLALLLGKPPGAAPAVRTTALPDVGPLPPTGLPADLLAMRPDVRAAGLRLRAEEWEISAARADRLPALSITGRAKYTSDGVDTLFDNWLANLAANLTGPIFDAGKRKAGVEKAQAQAEERLATYRRTVLTALSEVENSLVGEVRQKETVAALTREVETARITLLEAENQYTQGVSDYVNLLDELKDLQELQRKLVQEKARLVKERVALHRALGGSWPQDLAPEPARDTATAEGTNEQTKGVPTES
ncbi:rnd efflux system outer membrane lipoprotein nodt [Desulfoluna butyratoxydans]|uniref:Rnd efflux system outer membrane lipoprotein nodt n=1 Tax=Desulfoluna butyratoxydans TaxID=231438 RepID=A0A4U8YHU3_9BACT|nr:rnd efflux system outer membrane lipoprotein nodt [Desulfoluna butyratoxydans]